MIGEEFVFQGERVRVVYEEPVDSYTVVGRDAEGRVVRPSVPLRFVAMRVEPVPPPEPEPDREG